MREDAKAVEKPGPGRPSMSSLPKPPTTTEAQTKTNVNEPEVNKPDTDSTGGIVNKTKAGNTNSSKLGEPSIDLRRSSRSTRNPNPNYKDT